MASHFDQLPHDLLCYLLAIAIGPPAPCLVLVRCAHGQIRLVAKRWYRALHAVFANEKCKYVDQRTLGTRVALWRRMDVLAYIRKLCIWRGCEDRAATPLLLDEVCHLTALRALTGPLELTMSKTTTTTTLCRLPQLIEFSCSTERRLVRNGPHASSSFPWHQLTNLSLSFDSTDAGACVTMEAMARGLGRCTTRLRRLTIFDNQINSRRYCGRRRMDDGLGYEPLLAAVPAAVQSLWMTMARPTPAEVHSLCALRCLPALVHLGFNFYDDADRPATDHLAASFILSWVALCTALESLRVHLCDWHSTHVDARRGGPAIALPRGLTHLSVEHPSAIACVLSPTPPPPALRSLKVFGKGEHIGGELALALLLTYCTMPIDTLECENLDVWQPAPSLCITQLQWSRVWGRRLSVRVSLLYPHEYDSAWISFDNSGGCSLQIDGQSTRLDLPLPNVEARAVAAFIYAFHALWHHHYSALAPL